MAHFDQKAPFRLSRQVRDITLEIPQDLFVIGQCFPADDSADTWPGVLDN